MRINLKILMFSAIGAVFLLGFAFYNGYPIVYSDTSTYIASGFSLEPPADRPITYGLFILLTSFNGLSLWTVAFLQSFLLSFLILLTIKDFTHLKNPYTYFLFVIAFLSSLTVISFVSSQIITDIFPSIGILCILHLALNSKLKKLNSMLLFSIFFLANAMHMSHLLINFLMLISIIIIKKIFFREEISLNYKNIGILFVLMVLGIFTMGSSLAKSRNVFFMGRMAENGILVQFLNDNCKNKEYKLCDCIDSIPANTTDFLWDHKSPLYTKYRNWTEANAEFGAIIRQTVTTPKYLALHITESIKSTCKQLLAFNAGDGNGPFVGSTLLFKRMKEHFTFESFEYSKSRQNRGLLLAEKLRPVNILYSLVIITGLLSLILINSLKKLRNQIDAGKMFLILVFLISIFINSFVNASLVMVTDRFGAKMIWLIPFILLLVVPEIDFRRISRN